MDEEQFARKLAAYQLTRADIQEIFARSGGPGGQNVNKVSTAVTLKSDRAGISVTVEDSRSQSFNRALARERFIGKLEGRRRQEREDRKAEIERERRRKRPRPRGLKEKILETKKRRSEIKKGRAHPTD